MALRGSGCDSPWLHHFQSTTLLDGVVYFAMNFEPTFARIDTMTNKALNSTNRVEMAVELGNITGSILTVLELGCTEFDRINQYLAEVRAMMAMVEMRVIEL
jgi:hypothetical protein